MYLKEKSNSYRLKRKVIAEHFECAEDEVIDITQNGDLLKVFIDDMEIKYEAYISIYHYGVLLKEYIEDYAESLGLRGVWIDLNDLSKDEGYYFRHCSEVFEGLIEFMVIKDKQ